MQTMTRNNLYTNICFVFVEEVLKFRHVVKHKSIFAKLNFHQNFIFYKVNLFIGA